MAPGLSGLSRFKSGFPVKHITDICPQAVLRIYAIFPVHRNIILHNPFFWQERTGRNAVVKSLSRFQPRFLVMRNLFQYFSSIYAKSIYDKFNYPLFIFRQRAFRSFQKREACIINRIIFEIPEQIIYSG